MSHRYMSYCGCSDCSTERWGNGPVLPRSQPVPHNVRYPWPEYHSADCALSCGYDLGGEANNCTCGAYDERARRSTQDGVRGTHEGEKRRAE